MAPIDAKEQGLESESDTISVAFQNASGEVFLDLDFTAEQSRALRKNAARAGKSIEELLRQTFEAAGLFQA